MITGNDVHALAAATVYIPAIQEMADMRAIVCVRLVQAKTLYITMFLTFCLWFVIEFFVCFAFATVNIRAKKFLMETLFTCTPMLQNGGRERKCK